MGIVWFLRSQYTLKFLIRARKIRTIQEYSIFCHCRVLFSKIKNCGTLSLNKNESACLSFHSENSQSRLVKDRKSKIFSAASEPMMVGPRTSLNLFPPLFKLRQFYSYMYNFLNLISHRFFSKIILTHNILILYK